MKSKIVLLILFCGLSLTACTNSNPQQDTTSMESTPAQAVETNEAAVTENAKESDNETAYPVFTGIDISEKGLSYSTVNKNGLYQSFCCGDDIIYFSNPDDDWKLYSYDGETAECLADKKNTYSLNYYDGCVYFLSSEKDIKVNNELYPGKIYKYDTQSGEIAQINDNAGRRLYVDEHGIFYSKKDENKKNYVYKVDPQNGQEERFCEGTKVYFIDDYFIGGEQRDDGENWDYFLQSDNEKIRFISGEDISPDFVHNGVFYYTKGDEFNLYYIDLQTGEEGRTHSGYSYTVLDDEIYFSVQGIVNQKLFKEAGEEAEYIDVNGGKHTFIYPGDPVLPVEERFDIYTFRELYSDNKFLYALAEPDNGSHTYYMAKLEPKEVESGGETIEITFVRLIGNKTKPKNIFF